MAGAAAQSVREGRQGRDEGRAHRRERAVSERNADAGSEGGSPVSALPQKISSVEELEDALSRPPDYLVEMFKRVAGDIVILGVAGKMGPTLARMAQRAI